MSYADYRRKNTNPPNCRVLTKIDVGKFREFVVNSLKV
ncbi:MAG: nucleoside hydrolase [Tissierellia bacterium]|nr:nucleoside hydrolase [Tissierellia bacterium]